MPTTRRRIELMWKKSVLSVLLAFIMVFSLITPAYAATKAKTVTFNGGYIYQAEKGKPGTAQVKISNIVKTKKNVKISEKSLIKNYTETKETANLVFGYDENGDELKLKDIVTGEDGVTVYYADKAPVTVTTKTTLSCFWACYTGDEVKAKYTPKYYDFEDYYYNQEKAEVLTEIPYDYLMAPGTKMKLTKAGSYLFIIKDDGFISDSPFSAFCVIVK
jgi:hypothetical protein